MSDSALLDRVEQAISDALGGCREVNERGERCGAAVEVIACEPRVRTLAHEVLASAPFLQEGGGSNLRALCAEAASTETRA